MDRINIYRSEPQLAAHDLLGLDLTMVQSLILKEMWFCERALEIVSRGGGKTFLLGIISVLKCMLYPGCRVCITAPTFRQAKMVFSEIERLYILPNVNNSCDKAPFRLANNCSLGFKPVSYLDTSCIEVLPLNEVMVDISKFDFIFVDEASSIPIENLKLIDEGANKLILMSAGFYDTNLMWKLVSGRYQIRSTPHYLFPDGFFDKNNIAEAQRIMPNSEFRMEYEAAIVQGEGGN